MVDNSAQRQNIRNIKTDLHRAELFAGMLKSEAWAIYEALLNHHIGERMQDMFAPTPAGGESAEQHKKGAICGLMLARDLPRATVAAMKDIRESLEEANPPPPATGTGANKGAQS